MAKPFAMRNPMTSTLAVLLVLVSSTMARAQTPTYQLILKNDTVLSSTAYEFDISLVRTAATPLELATLQMVLTFDTSVSSGTLTFSMNGGTSQLNSSQQPASMSVVGNELRINPRVPPGAGSGTIVPASPGLTVGRFRLTSSVPFANKPASVGWKNINNPYTKVFAYVSALNTEVTDSTGHLNNLVNHSLSPVTITSASPRPFATAGTAYNDTLTASGGTPPYSWSVTGGALPAGLSLSSAGFVNGTATVAGTYNFTAQVTDTFSISSSKAFSLTVNPAGASKVVFVQPPTSATAGVTIAPPVTVQLKDPFNNIVPTASVSITVSMASGTGILSGPTTQSTNASGLATFGNLSIDIAGSKALRAASGSLQPDTSSVLTITAGSAKQLAFAQQPSNATAGTAIGPAVAVQMKDSLGNNVSTGGVLVTLTLTTGTGTLSGTTTQPTNGSGLATFGDLNINLAGSKNLTAMSGSLTATVSSAFTISPRPAKKLIVVQQPANSTAGAAISPPVTIQVQDSLGNNVAGAGVSVSMTQSSGTGTLSGTTPQPTDVNGLATFNDLSINLTGTKRLTASAGGLTPAVSDSFTISPGAANQLVFVQQPGNGVAGAYINPPVTVRLKDQFTNNVLTAGVSITMSKASGTGTLGGVTARTTNGSGLATFDSLRFDQPGTKTLRASSTGLTAATSDSFTLGTLSIIATAGSNGTISPSGTVSVVQGTDQTFTITPNTGYHIDTLKVDGAPVTPVSPYTFTNVQTGHTISATFAPNSLQITVQTNVAGLLITVDGVQYSSPHTFTWTAATNHTISADSIQNATSSTRLVWNTWSDGGTRLHTVTPLVDSTFTANFVTQYFLTMVANPGGTVTPASGWYNSGQNVVITGILDTNYIFNSWAGTGTGYYSGPINPRTITIGGPITETGSFQHLPVTVNIRTNPEGRGFTIDGSITYTSTQTRSWQPGDNHTLNVNSPQILSSTVRYQWRNWSDGGGQSHVVTVPDTNVTYTANFALQYLLTTVAGAGGAVSPATAWNDSGTAVQLTATPNTGYHFMGWRGSGAGSFTGMTNPVTITMQSPVYDTASFAIDTLTITAAAGLNGSISPSGSVSVLYGSNQSFVITPDPGYHIDSVLVDGGYAGKPASYTFTTVTANHAISVKFAINTYTITASAAPNGSINPVGAVVVNYNSSQAFTISPTSGYHVDSVIVDGVRVDSTASYTFINVVANHSITAKFAINRYTINASASPNGAIVPPGAVSANYGTSQRFTITPSAGYGVDSVIVDGVKVDSVLTYTFVNITNNHTIRATFAANLLTITVTTNPMGLSVVVDGGAPSPGPRVVSWLAGTSHAISVVDTASGAPGVRYVWSAWSDTGAKSHTVSPLINTTYSANFTSQYFLTMNANLGGTVTPASGWYNSGQNLVITGIPDINYSFNSWAGAGTGSYSGAANPRTISMGGPISETASFQRNPVTVTIRTDPAGRGFRIDGSATYTTAQTRSWQPGDAHTLSVDSPQPISTGVQYVWNTWNDGGGQSHVITVPDTNVVYSAGFQLQYFLTTAAGTGGTVSPASAWKDSGAVVQLNATPNTGFHFVDWKGGGTGSYTGSNSSPTVTMESPVYDTAHFAIDTLTIVASAGVNGSITPSGAVPVPYGTNQLFTITPAANYHVDSVLADGVYKGGVTSYTFTNVTANHTITATFKINASTITASAGANGSISPSGSVLVNYGDNQSFIIAPNAGYHVAEVLVDGVSVGAVTSYDFLAVVANHTISASFAINTYAIVASAGAHGTIAPSGNVNVNYGANQKFTITPGAGYGVDSVVVDAVKVDSVLSYTFVNITSDHTIRASFAANLLTITLTTNPVGRSVVIDGGAPSPSPRVVSWLAGTSHSISVIDTVGGGAGTRYVWAAWSDTGAKSHTVSPLVNTTYTASFTTQYFLTMNTNPGGSVTPASGWYNSGQSVQIQAIADSFNVFTAWAGTGVGSYSGTTNPKTITIGGAITETASFQRQPVTANIQTNPPGRAFSIDGGPTYTTPQTRTWQPGETHIISVSSPQNISPAIRYVWANWSDAGSQSHSITVPDMDVTYTADFTLQYLLTTSAGTGGAVSPASAWYDSGKAVTITATPNAGYAFLSWTGTGNGSYSGTNNPASVTMDGPVTETAGFGTTVRVTITSNPAGRSVIVDDSTSMSPRVVNWLRGSSHTISTASPQSGTPGTGYSWRAWSDGGAVTHSVAPVGDTTFTALFEPYYLLTINVGEGGYTTPSSNYYAKDRRVLITAIPFNGYAFVRWIGSGSGSYSGTNNPDTVVMNEPITETAVFGLILPPPILARPRDDSSGVDPAPQLSWNSYTGASEYNVQVAKDSVFTAAAVVFERSGIVDTSVRVDSLANLTKYFWRVNARVDSDFTLFSHACSFTTKTATISVYSPGRNWASGYTYPISWTDNSLSGNVDVLLTLDSGKTFMNIESNIANSGGASWTIPDTIARQMIDSCRLRVRSVLNNSIFGESEVFSLVPGALPSSVRLSASVPFPDEPSSSVEYRLISFPGIVDTALKIGQFQLGSEKTEWRAFSDNGLAENYLVELSSTSSVTTGTGYWLLKKRNLTIPSYDMTMPPLAADATFSIPLHRGWNIIGNPFNRDLLWRDVLLANKLSPTAKLNSYAGSYYEDSVLTPFKGYYYLNSDSLPVLTLPYPFGSRPVAAASPHINWRIQLSFESDINRDEGNYVGIAPIAKAGQDQLDNHKPPFFLDQGFLYFPRPEWNHEYSRFSSDFRPGLGDGQVWEFEIHNPRKSKGRISFKGINQVPLKNGVVLVNLNDTQPVDLRANSDYRFEWMAPIMRFKLIVGQNAFIGREVANLIPTEFDLAQNFPNPFNSLTSISVRLPNETHLVLEVFNILGQRVRSLAEGQYPQGVHTFVWDGTDGTGNAVSSGVYLYRLTEGGKSLGVKKMILSK